MLRRQLKGSFTVEASVLLPLTTFFLIAILYYICCLHDRAMMQTYALRAAEASLTAPCYEDMEVDTRAEEGSAQDSMIMSKVQEPDSHAEGISLLAAYRSLKSYRIAEAKIFGEFEIAIPQVAAFTGGNWETEYHLRAVTVDYPADYLKQKLKKALQ